MATIHKALVEQLPAASCPRHGISWSFLESAATTLAQVTQALGSTALHADSSSITRHQLFDSKGNWTITSFMLLQPASCLDPTSPWSSKLDDIAALENSLSQLLSTNIIYADVLPPQFRCIRWTTRHCNTIDKCTNVAAPTLPSSIIFANDFKATTLSLLELLESTIGSSPMRAHLGPLLTHPSLLRMHACIITQKASSRSGHPKARFFCIAVADSPCGRNIAHAIHAILDQAPDNVAVGLTSAERRPVPIHPFPASPAARAQAVHACSAAARATRNTTIHHVAFSAINTHAARATLAANIDRCHGLHTNLVYGDTNASLTVSFDPQSELATATPDEVGEALFTILPALRPSDTQVAAGQNLAAIAKRGSAARRQANDATTQQDGGARGGPASSRRDSPSAPTPPDETSPAGPHHDPPSSFTPAPPPHPPARSPKHPQHGRRGRRNSHGRRPRNNPFQSGHSGKSKLWYASRNAKGGRRGIVVTQDWTVMQRLTAGVSGCIFKSFPSYDAALRWISEGLPDGMVVKNETDIRAIWANTPLSETNLTNPFLTSIPANGWSKEFTYTEDNDAALSALRSIAGSPTIPQALGASN